MVLVCHPNFFLSGSIWPPLRKISGAPLHTDWLCSMQYVMIFRTQLLSGCMQCACVAFTDLLSLLVFMTLWTWECHRLTELLSDIPLLVFPPLLGPVPASPPPSEARNGPAWSGLADDSSAPQCSELLAGHQIQEKTMASYHNIATNSSSVLISPSPAPTVPHPVLTPASDPPIRAHPSISVVFFWAMIKHLVRMQIRIVYSYRQKG